MKSIRVCNSAHPGLRTLTTNFRKARKIFSLTLLAAAVALWGGKAQAANGTWTNLTSGGNWSNTANWNGGTVANSGTADFNTINITADNTVHLDSARTITGLTFGDTVTSSGSEASWILDNNGNSANTLTGIGTITVNALGTGKSATISALIAGNTPITKSGTGTLVLSGTNTFNKTDSNNASYAWRLSAGTVVIASDSAFGVTTGTGINATTLVNLNAAALQASGSARTVANPTWLSQSTTVSGDQSITFSGTFSGRSTDPTLTCNITSPATLSLTGNVYTDFASGFHTITFTGTGNTLISGAIANNTGGVAALGKITKSGNGTLTLSGTNTYSGNTTVNTGGPLILDPAGSLKFFPTLNNTCNKITGAGTATLNGTFNIDLTGANITAGNAWTLVDVTTKTYGGTFAVTGFSNNSGVWTKTDGNNTWTFTQSTGVLGLAFTYAVTYNANSASSGTAPTDSSSPYSSGATVTVKSNSGTLARTGYTFGGWNTVTNGSGTHYDATGSVTFSMPASAVTLYAEWTGTVTYDANGGTGTPPTDETAYKQNQSATAKANTDLARESYTFAGWNTLADGNGTTYAAGSGSIPMSGGNVTLYAKWTTSLPAITTSGTLSSVNTTYGTASASPTSFTVSGADMVAGITVTPPAGFEVTQTAGGASGYAGSGTAIIVGSAGTIAETTVYVRLAALAAVGSSPYSGNVTCTSSSATQKDVATAPSTVSPATLTLTANNQNKTYGTTQTTPVTSSAAFTPTGLQNSETVGTVTLTYGTGGLDAGDPAGNTSTITPSAAAGGTFTAGNYNIGYVAGTLTVVKATPTATLVVNNSPVTYDGSAHAATVSITTSSVPGTVQNILTGGAATQTAAGTYAVTADFVPNDTGNYNTLTAQGAGNFIINNPPTSTGGSVSMRLNTTNTFAASNFQFSDTDGGTLSAIKVVTSLPSYGTLKLNGTPITEVPSAEILVATITNLTYTPNTDYVGADSFKFQVRDATAYSADATLAITVTSDILVQNGSFETPGNAGSPWSTFGSPWSVISSPSIYQQIKAVDGGAFTNAPDGLWVGLINGDDCPITAPLTQNLGVSVKVGDTLTVTFQRGNPLVSPGGAGVAYFDVAGTKYTTAFDTSTLAAGGWQLTTMTHKITNSGNLTLGFYGTTGHSTNVWVDAISNVSVTPEPPKGTVIILW